MTKLENINISSDKTYEIVKECLYSCKTSPIIVNDTKYHHDINLKDTPSAIQYGLLSPEKRALSQGRNLTKEELFILSDECHVNGKEYISLSSMEVDFSQMYRDEFVYESSKSLETDIIVSKDIKTMKNTINYFNEFLVEDIIPVEKFNAIDVRILNINKHNQFRSETQEFRNQKLLEYYEQLRLIAKALIDYKRDIPFREASEEFVTLDPEKVIKLPKIIIK